MSATLATALPAVPPIGVPAARTYSSFWPLLIFLAAVFYMDFNETVTLHREKLARLHDYAATLKLRDEVLAKTSWVSHLRADLVRLAPGHPEAAKIVADLHLAATDSAEVSR